MAPFAVGSLSFTRASHAVADADVFASFFSVPPVPSPVVNVHDGTARCETGAGVRVKGVEKCGGFCDEYLG